MAVLLSKNCPYCGVDFLTYNVRRIYDTDRCRREFQNERRRDERAERRAARHSAWDDPWERDDWEIYGNALLDAMPVIEDNPWGGPSVQPAKKKSRKKEKNPGWLWLPGVPQ